MSVAGKQRNASDGEQSFNDETPFLELSVVSLLSLL